jgi:hypothetical protein
MKRGSILSVIVTLMLPAARSVTTAQQYDCIISNGQKCYVYYDSTGNATDTVCDQGSVGIGTFRGQGLSGTGPVATELLPVAVTASISDPSYGTIVTALDPTRASSFATITSIDPPNRFPLDVNISFFATASVGSKPGTLYRSRTQLLFSSNRITSLNPFNGETLVLKDNAEFYDAADPAQHTVFALLGGSTRVTLGIRTPQPQYTCILINGRKCYINYGPNGNPIDTVCDQGGTGVGTFVSLTGAFSSDSVVNTELTPINITAAIPDARYGTITTRLDPSRTSGVTTIRSTNGASRFPLDVNIRFFATASVESKPGVVYNSRTQLLFSSRGVTSLNPFRGEIATLSSDVEFYDAADSSQRTVFTLQGGRTTVTLTTPTPSGPKYTCILINGRKCYVNYDSTGRPIDTTCDVGSKGIGTFTSLTGVLPPDSAVNAVLHPVAISATIPDPIRGTITTALDPARPSSPATIRSVDGRNRFPLDVSISFFATASIESKPGVVYNSRTQLVFSSRKVRSLDPFVNEVLTLAESVEFYNAADPLQRTEFALRGGESTVTLSGQISRVEEDGTVKLRLDLK